MISILFALLLAQTKIDLPTQAKNPNFGAMAHTTPQGVGASLPGTCSVGEVFFLTTATAGQNLFLCSGTNTWSQLIAGGGAATSFGQLTDFAMSVSGAVLTIGPNCSMLKPCNYRLNSNTIAVNSPITGTVTGGAGVSYVYGDAGGIKIASTGLTVTCSGCSFVNGSSQPANAVPIGTASSTSGSAWDISGVTDLRGFMYQKVLTTGFGIILTELPGSTQLSIDGASIQYVVAVPSTATTACSPGQFAVSTTFRYDCVSTNVWRRVAVAAW